VRTSGSDMVDYYRIDVPGSISTADLIKGSPTIPSCKDCRRHLDKHYHKSAHVKLGSGRLPLDFLLIVDSTIAVSPKARVAFESDGLEGLRFGVITFASRRPKEDFHLMFPAGPPALWPEPGLVTTGHCRTCRRGIPDEVPECFAHGEGVDEGTIGKSDLFAADNFPFLLFVTRRFVETCRRHKLRGVEFSDRRKRKSFYDLDPDIVLR
jgi:hypothetical protein